MQIKSYILDTPNGYAAFNFAADNWFTTESLDDSLLTIEAESLEDAVRQAGELVGGIRYRRADSASFQDAKLHTFTVLDLEAERAERAEAAANE